MTGLEGIRRRLRRDSEEAQAESLLSEAGSRLDEIASASRAASVALRGRVDEPTGSTESRAQSVHDLIEALVTRVEEIEAEALRLASLVNRADVRLSEGPHEDPPANAPGPSAAADDGTDGGVEDDEAAVRAEEVRALVTLLAGAGASRQEIGAWVFREHGVVVSGRAMNEMILAQIIRTT